MEIEFHNNLGTWPTSPWQPDQSVVKVCRTSALSHPGTDDLVVLVIDLLLQQHLVHHRDEDRVLLAELNLKNKLLDSITWLDPFDKFSSRVDTTKRTSHDAKLV